MKKILILVLAVALTAVTYDCIEKNGIEVSKTSEDKVKVAYHQEEKIITESNLEEIHVGEELTDYITRINNEVEIITAKETLTENDEITLKNAFITITDFIFYDGKIKGKTFNELSNSVKESIICLYEKIDSKIEEKLPGYKESIQDATTKTYDNIKEKLTDLKNSIISSYKQEIGDTNYGEQEELINESINAMKESISPIIDIIADKSKEIYQETKDKTDSWYQTWKEDNAQ